MKFSVLLVGFMVIPCTRHHFSLLTSHKTVVWCQSRDVVTDVVGILNPPILTWVLHSALYNLSLSPGNHCLFFIFTILLFQEWAHSACKILGLACLPYIVLWRFFQAVCINTWFLFIVVLCSWVWMYYRLSKGFPVETSGLFPVWDC